MKHLLPTTVAFFFACSAAFPARGQGKLTGRVVDATTGNAIPGVEVGAVRAATVKGQVCGFYSTLPTRKAWGCYPQALSDAEGKGHSMRFLDALAPGLSLGDRHDLVVVSDQTPNVPHRSSDYFLVEFIQSEAQSNKVSLPRLVDTLLE